MTIRLELKFEGEEVKPLQTSGKKKPRQMSEFGSGFGDSTTKTKKRKAKKNK